MTVVSVKKYSERHKPVLCEVIAWVLPSVRVCCIVVVLTRHFILAAFRWPQTRKRAKMLVMQFYMKLA